MSWYEIAALMVGLALGFLLLGFPVAFAFIAANIIGVLLFMGGTAGLDQLISNGAASIDSFLLVAIPLFIVMGELFFHSGLSKRAFDALDKLFGAIPGRLAYITIAGGTIVAWLSGSAMASVAMLGAVMLPEMQRRGYKNRLSIGPILCAGTLDILIPPSALMVLLGSIGRVDVGALMIAGVIPGMLLALMYAATVYILVKLDPSAAPAYEVERIPLGRKLKLAVTELLPFAVVLLAVVGTILWGIATPSESAAFGVLAVMVLMVAYRVFSWSAVVKALNGAVRVSVMVFMILLGAATFSQILAYAGATSGLVEWAMAANVGPYGMLAIMFITMQVLGMFIDAISIMLLTVPIFMPILQQIGFDPVLFGVLLMISLGIDGILPPFGVLIFVMQGITRGQVSISEIVMSSLPYLACALVLIALLLVFPQIALYLPSKMG